MLKFVYTHWVLISPNSSKKIKCPARLWGLKLKLISSKTIFGGSNFSRFSLRSLFWSSIHSYWILKVIPPLSCRRCLSESHLGIFHLTYFGYLYVLMLLYSITAAELCRQVFLISRDNKSPRFDHIRHQVHAVSETFSKAFCNLFVHF